MYAKKIKYEDFNGNEKERKFYFNFTKAEILEMELSTNGGYTTYLNRIIETEDQATLVKIFKELILKAYGVKSDDGELFIKNDEVLAKFTQSNAYSELFTELSTNTNSAIEFCNGVFPPALMKQIQNSPEYQQKIEELIKNNLPQND